MKYFLGMAANYSRKERLAHTFAIGRRRDCQNLKTYLKKKYDGEVILCKNGRSALALALKAYFEPGDGIIVNGFTCYAVYEAIKAAGLKPVFVDISKKDLNFNTRTLPKLDAKSDSSNVQVRGIIIQNTLGNPADIKAIEKFAKEHSLTIIEDLAHCAGSKYSDGREVGTVGVAAALSFGKDKSIDTISGGAVILRKPQKHEIKAPTKLPKLSDHLRARFYPLFGAICRGLTYLHLGGALMRLLVKIHWVEKSADNKLDLDRTLSKFEAKLALKQLQVFKKTGAMPLRNFYLVNNREELLKELAKHGFYFNGFWYEKPVSPERYYKKIHFPEEECQNAVFVAQHIINLPTYYSKQDLEPAQKIIEPFLVKEEK
ncbi:DegT/DnrJ/EryC1/StrS aminotransferase family protein [Candidatus Saccharibacteria bacterium]|nr:DegT/DnrJ/EryC1/StrS aminotransferase family protein [Candidatus Saccharibacteria bacterium]